MLEITGCSRPGMWYADKIGQRVPFEGYWLSEGCYKSREPAGHINRVEVADAVVVDVAPSGVPEPAQQRLEDVTLWLPAAELLRLAEFGGFVRARPKAAPGFVPVRVVSHG